MAGLLAGVPAAFCVADWLAAPRVWPGSHGASLPWSVATLGLEPAAAYPYPWEGPDSRSEVSSLVLLMYILSHVSAETGRNLRPLPEHMDFQAAFPPEQFHSPVRNQERVGDPSALPLDDQQLFDRKSDD
eukprot:6810076-Pyramimonas_sp.AAC.1